MKYSLALILTLLAFSNANAAERPNIIWIVAEDTSPWMGCYGHEVNKGKTPNMDSIANSGVLFTRAFVPAPVCSACRSAFMVGQNQIRFGAHEHRSSRGERKIHLPDGVKILPQIMKENGFFTFNLGKDDYNFVWDQKAVYDLIVPSKRDKKFPWDEVKKQQPFFGQIQTRGGKHNTDKFPENRKVDRSKVTVPADYPDNEVQREFVAEHYDSIRKDDDYIGNILKILKEKGLDKNTIVVYFGDHGANNLIRHKQMPTEGGLHVPFMISGPKPFINGSKVRNDLVSILDLSATTLAWAGIDKPSWYEGQNLFGEDYKPIEFLGSAKDRLDHTIDRVRSIRSDKFRFTRNYKFDRILLQPQYRDGRPFLQNLHDLYKQDKLSPIHKKIYFGERDPEEFYDVVNDPAQVNNLVNDPKYKAEVERHRKALNAWIAKGDMGIGDEPIAELKNNGEGTKWGEGVNPEYEVYRKDSDGDGLSDKWESLNGRDPNDGKLVFNFDCGGWQTEGWRSVGMCCNLAGYLGFLDFNLVRSHGAIVRSELNVQAMPKDKSLQIKLKSSDDIKMQVSANGNTLSTSVILVQKDKLETVSIPLSKKQNWNGTISTLKVDFYGTKGTLIEVDSISVQR